MCVSLAMSGQVASLTFLQLQSGHEVTAAAVNEARDMRPRMQVPDSRDSP